ncbi:TOBE domain-containing protein, partial [uncultured Brevundimonas sp.]|uniref:TOBE domain-containing protein n=1 Tax=uncultured Brevundimonas sp. TaxID=213418 RepID=UPI0025F6BB8D
VHAAVDASQAAPGDPVSLGVRPEHLTLSGEGDALSIEALFVETLGAATYAYFSHPAGSETLTVQLPGDARPQTGERLTLRIPAGQTHLFDADGAAFRRLV